MLTFHVLTDFSATAANALRYAEVLARHLGAHLRLWHVLPETNGVEGRYFSAAAGGLTATESAQQLAELARKISRSVPCTHEVITSDAAARLTAAMRSSVGHIIVVGNSNPAKRMTTAATSTALYVVRQVAQPLLVVPATFRAGPVPRRIVLDTDRRAVRLPATAETIPALLAQLTYARFPLTLSHLPSDVDHLLIRIIPEVVGIHVYTSEFSPKMAEIAAQLHQTGLLRGVAHTVATARHPSIEQGIRHAAARYRADMLSFVTRQRSFTGTQFLQSVTARLLAHSRIPVLTIAEV
ncbi:universal stress protein [Hymenobacter sublimis]|uniref:Universal stress protein n=1 Tax=Hymenobacter sublimis TaxID=2933777 RepID=A0ABY4JFM2_9BACT|nr:universal stress protein [Hymenobacter sublimis]UPL50159.1 universal stress protein [Hymenobacter sublimis]